MKESYKEELAIHFGLEPYAGDGDIPGVASARGNAENQMEHHRVNSLQDEFRLLLDKHAIEYDENYIWE